MSLLIFLLLGLVAGWLASYVMRGGFGLVGDMVVGVIGAFIGGWLFSTLAGRNITGFDLPSILIAFVGACILIALLRLLSGRRTVV
ncbi:MAG TPA: GlsB/YeaQ/YmgE family stress response membrane protein [Chloroflexota bacterium]|nr:GlsB/YeaQ/YmgE family stress response membrane protein [Chloroflexota bacterium]